MIKHVEIVNKQGRTLRGYLHLPEGAKEILVMFHGFTGNKTEHAGHFRNFARLLEKEGVASLRMDFSGNGESDGEFADFTFDTMMDEARQMIEYAKNISGIEKVDLLGFSMGGAVAGMMAREYMEQINKLMLWSPAGNIVDLIKKRYENNEKNEKGNVIFGGYWELSKEMYESLDKYNTYEGLENFPNKVFIVHGSQDLSVNYLFGMRYAVRCKNSFIHLVNGSGHGYDPLAHRDELYSKSLDFILGKNC